jgi:hypothetical protein
MLRSLPPNIALIAGQPSPIASVAVSCGFVGQAVVAVEAVGVPAAIVVMVLGSTTGVCALATPATRMSERARNTTGRRWRKELMDGLKDGPKQQTCSQA